MYQDNQIINNENAFKVRANFHSLDSLETTDLEEILQKLDNQKDKLVHIPNSEQLISSINDDIYKLKAVIPYTNVASTTIDSTQHAPEKEQVRLSPNNFPTQTTQEQYNNQAPKPQRKKTILERSLLGQLLGGLRRKSRQAPQTTNPEPQPASAQHINNYHNECLKEYRYPETFSPHPYPHQDSCRQIDKCITGEIDIIRLLLLYLSLRPRCRYSKVLSDIAVNNLNILGRLLEQK